MPFCTCPASLLVVFPVFLFFLIKLLIYFISCSQLLCPPLPPVPPSHLLSPLPSTAPLLILRKGKATHGYQPALAYQVAVRLHLLYGVWADEAAQKGKRDPEKVPQQQKTEVV